MNIWIFVPPTFHEVFPIFLGALAKDWKYRKYLANMNENVNSNMRFRQVDPCPNHMIYLYREQIVVCCFCVGTSNIKFKSKSWFISAHCFLGFLKCQILTFVYLWISHIKKFARKIAKLKPHYLPNG